MNNPTETGFDKVFRYRFPRPHAVDFALFALHGAMTK